MKVIIDEKRIEEFLSRGVEKIYPSKEAFKKVLMSGKKLTIYNGIDPTGSDLHIGHSSVLFKLKELQNLGHQVILLIGDFTGMIGDPTDKTATRKQLTAKEIKENMKNYIKQAGKILDIKNVNVKYNSKWLSKLKFEDVMNLASEFTVQQMLERDMFEKRIKEGKPIYIHEFFYPIMQGFDSVAMDVDAEIGGNDQTFNMLAGRTMMKNRGKEKFVLTTKLLVDPTGKKMGKTEGNMITLSDSSNDIFGKVMSWPDTLMPLGFEICTRLIDSDINLILSENPRDQKMKLAYEIVKIYHGEKKAKKAEENFINTFQKKEIPEEMTEVKINAGESLMDVLVKNKILSSNGEFRRLVEEKAITNLDSGEKINDIHFILKSQMKFKIGKRRFVKII